MRRLLVVLVFSAIAVGVAVVLFGERLTLIPEGRISIQETPDGKREVAIIGAGERVPVVRCIDDKSLIVPEVRLPDGSTGFVVYGTFRLERGTVFSSSTKAPVNFSCPRP